MGAPVLSVSNIEADVIALELVLLTSAGASETALVDALLLAVDDRLTDGVLAVLFASIRMAAGTPHT